MTNRMCVVTLLAGVRVGTAYSQDASRQKNDIKLIAAIGYKF